MASAMIGNLAVSLTMNTAAFQAGASLAEKRSAQMQGRFAGVTASAKQIGAAIGATFIADALYRTAAGAFEMASSLSEAAEQAGLTVEGLQELRFAAEQTGVGGDKVEAAMKRLSKSLGELQLGEKAATKTFAAIGLSADDLRGKRPDEALRVIADALNKLPDASQRVAIGQQLMGRSFSDLLPLINGGSAALDQYAEKSRENGQISTEDAAKLDELADTWGELKTRIAVATANIIAAVIPMAESMIAFLDNVRMSVHNFREGVISGFAAAGQAVGNFVIGVRDWVAGTLNAVWDGAIAKIRAVEGAFKWLYDKVVGNSWVPDMVQKIGFEMSSLDQTMVGQAQTVAVRVEKSFKDMADATLASLSRLSGAIKSGGFLGILEAVIGVGMQLGSVGAFGKGVAARLNAPATGGFVSPPRGGGNGGSTIEVVPSPYFNVVVDGRVNQAAPGIMQGGAAMAGAQSARSKKWSLA